MPHRRRPPGRISPLDFDAQPFAITNEQRVHSVDDISRSNSAKHNPKAKSWMDKVRDFFAG